MSNKQLEHVTDAESTKDMWEKTKNVFEGHALLNMLTARRRSYTVSIKAREKVLSYFNRVKQLAATLKSMDVVIDDKKMAMAVLNRLQ